MPDRWKFEVAALLSQIGYVTIPLDVMEKAQTDEPLSEDEQNMLSDNGQQRIHRAGPVLLQAVNQRGRQTVRSLVESAWISLGGPACVENTSELDDAATYFDLLDSLQTENLPVDRDTSICV